MRSKWIGSLLFIVLSGGLARGQEAASLAGNWYGAIEVPGGKLRVAFRISSEGGALKAVMDSLDQGAKDIPVSKVELKDGRAIIEVAVIGGVFEGRLGAKGDSLDGEWRQSGQRLRLKLQRVKDVPSAHRPQTPKGPFPYEAREVAFHHSPGVPGSAASGEGTKEQVTLKGTLTLPRSASKSRWPAAILISGSGPQDRDETLMEHKPFAVIADSLTRAGVAVLRFDDRGVGASTGRPFPWATSADNAEDVRAAVQFLRGCPEVDANRIGLIGHSEGGLIGPMVAAEDSRIAFVVLLAGPGVAGSEILKLQTSLILRANGAPEATIQRVREQQEAIFPILTGPGSMERRSAEALTALRKLFDALPEAERAAVKDPETQIKNSLAGLTHPWMDYFLRYDPKPALRKLRCPVLVVNGSKDLQVDTQQNVPAITAAVLEGGNSQLSVEVLPGLNHLFQSCKTGSPAEYASIEETHAKALLKLLSRWVPEHSQGRRAKLY